AELEQNALQSDVADDPFCDGPASREVHEPDEFVGRQRAADLRPTVNDIEHAVWHTRVEAGLREQDRKPRSLWMRLEYGGVSSSERRAKLMADRVEGCIER